MDLNQEGAQWFIFLSCSLIPSLKKAPTFWVSPLLGMVLIIYVCRGRGKVAYVLLLMCKWWTTSTGFQSEL